MLFPSASAKRRYRFQVPMGSRGKLCLARGSRDRLSLAEGLGGGGQA